jgi:hypothetical protein
MWRLIPCSLAFLLCLGAASAQTISAPSVWTNQRGSVLTILAIDAAGHFQGTYVNNAPGTQCLGFPYDAKGAVTGDEVTLIVTFAPCDTVTVWEGRIAATTIKTRFEAAYPSGGHITIWRGADIFTRQ